MLNKQQQLLVEQNHQLIFGFIQKKKLDIDEYYDLLAISLCKAAKSYQSDKGMFSTWVYAIMENDLKQYWRHNTNSKTVPAEMIISCDTPLESDEDGKCTLLDILPDKKIEDEDFRMRYNDLLDKMNETEKTICQMLMNGAKGTDIIERLGITRRKYQHIRARIKEKYYKMW